MTWLALSMKEWRRRPLRAIVTTMGVGIAVAALFSLLAFQRGYSNGVRTELDRLGAHVLVVPKGCPYDAASMALHGASWPCYLKQKYIEEVRQTAGIAAAAPVFMAATDGPDGRQAVYVGVDADILSVKRAWRIDGSFPQRAGELLVGSEMARRAGWQLGERVSLPGLREQTGIVAGLLAPTQGADDTFVYLRLRDAQERFKHPGELTHILVKLADPNDVETVVNRLKGCDAGLAMNVVPLAHVFHTIQSLVNSTRWLLGCIALIALLVAGAGVSNAILMAVSERIREIGVLRALGASPRDIFQLIWMETILVCCGGASVGVLLAFAASKNVETWVRSQLPFAPTDALIRWEFWNVAICFFCALALGSLAGFVPAWRAARVPPMSAIRAPGGWV